MKRKVLIIGLPSVAAVLVIGLLVTMSHQGSEPIATAPDSTVLSEQRITLEDVGLAATIPKALDVNTLTDADIQDNVVLRLTSTNPPILASVRFETGLRALATTTAQDLLELVTSNARRSLPDRFPGYAELSFQESLVVSGKEASKIEYSYTGPSGTEVGQALVIIRKDNDTAVYISFQAELAKFYELSENYLVPLVNSFEIQ